MDETNLTWEKKYWQLKCIWVVRNKKTYSIFPPPLPSWSLLLHSGLPILTPSCAGIWLASFTLTSFSYVLSLSLCFWPAFETRCWGWCTLVWTDIDKCSSMLFEIFFFLHLWVFLCVWRGEGNVALWKIVWEIPGDLGSIHIYM